MVSPVVICHQLRSPENLGAIARAMANFGFTDLILADPATHDFRGVETLAVKADSVLERLAIAPTLPEALASVVFAVGTTSRTNLKRHSVLSPEEGIARLAEHARRGKVALVLGGEKRGLSDEELAWCHEVIAIPTPGPQPSMNLAQAATVLLYLCSRAAAPAPTLAVSAGAPLALVHRLEERLREVLSVAEFLNPQAPQHALHELSRALVRGQLSQREVEVWLSAVDHLRRHVR
jgi:tRNA/rRNA methyltransferase